MTKSVILSALAVISLALSYLYEVSPTQQGTPVAGATATAPVTPYAINSPEDMVRAMEWSAPAADTAAPEPVLKEYYVRKLGLRFKDPNYKQLVETASAWIGTPYQYGRNSRKGTDCSGFVTRVFHDVYGVNLSRSSGSMFQDVRRVNKGKMRTGDLVFFRRSAKGPIYHVGIYLKNNKFIHSATNGGVRVSSLKEPYYSKNFYAAGRVI
ncbi:NlpC/P60 family protein [Pontibacter sp. E15-1]|uniref:C40 family peptidase n=1 Tax=Pontibacter sp. E15-1 TaxID=2919918 RepID=UPI001F4F6F9F|nr:NlpC/P60 family protein [Pontibacter sp. E15-1]MCJ8165442.1 NlpC/P60 family protein [Pontibacter sp. E15-1]